ncbi:hypothetical protein, partial [Photobacterium damselae]|uniref:hypothetical protein n=1 Tax=Photobacterium damselae TaxID=38293 RepID=UPI002F3EF6B3
LKIASKRLAILVSQLKIYYFAIKPNCNTSASVVVVVTLVFSPSILVCTLSDGAVSCQCPFTVKILVTGCVTCNHQALVVLLFHLHLESFEYFRYYIQPALKKD